MQRLQSFALLKQSMLHFSIKYSTYRTNNSRGCYGMSKIVDDPLLSSLPPECTRSHLSKDGPNDHDGNGSTARGTESRECSSWSDESEIWGRNELADDRDEQVYSRPTFPSGTSNLNSSHQREASSSGRCSGSSMGNAPPGRRVVDAAMCASR